MKPIPVAAIALLAAAPAFALPAITIDFESVSSFAPIAAFYDGGADGAGQTGPALGATFGADALGLKNDFDIYFTNAPSPLGVMTPVGADAILNFAQGFAGTLVLHYAASEAVANGVQVWSGLGGTGTLLASFDLAANAQADGCSDSAYCHFASLAGGFVGTARSVSFGNAAYAAAFDDVRLSPVPEPATALLMVLGLGGGLVAARRRR